MCTLYSGLETVVIAGASGLIGSHLIQFFLKEEKIDEVVALVRKPLPVSHNKFKQKVVSFDDYLVLKELVKGSALFCCLGSTKKKTPHLIDYRRVDHDYPLLLARCASENKVSQLHIVTALGADVKSINFYSRLKGEVEKDVTLLKFKSLHLYKPSLLTGDRAENRPMEQAAKFIMKLINPFLTGSLKKYQSIKAEVVAKAMLTQYNKDLDGTFYYPSDKIKELV